MFPKCFRNSVGILADVDEIFVSEVERKLSRKLEMRNFGGILPNFFRTSEVRKMKENFKMRKCYVTEKMESQQKKVSLQS